MFVTHCDTTIDASNITVILLNDLRCTPKVGIINPISGQLALTAGDGITITGTNVTLNLNGKTITSNPYQGGTDVFIATGFANTGVMIGARTRAANVRVVNGTIVNFTYGIDVRSVDGVGIVLVKATGGRRGIRVAKPGGSVTNVCLFANALDVNGIGVVVNVPVAAFSMFSNNFFRSNTCAIGLPPGVVGNPFPLNEFLGNTRTTCG